MMKVAILGAPHTGKTELAKALEARLAELGLSIEIADAALLNSISSSDGGLLCGLDLEAPRPDQIQADLMIRSALQATAMSFQVVYGLGSQRLENALYCLGRRFPEHAQQLDRPEPPTRWHGPCDVCSDGECEHRLFSRLTPT